MLLIFFMNALGLLLSGNQKSKFNKGYDLFLQMIYATAALRRLNYRGSNSPIICLLADFSMGERLYCIISEKK